MNEGASLFDFGQTEPKAKPLQDQGINWREVIQNIQSVYGLSGPSQQRGAMQFPGLQAQQPQGSTAPIYQLPQIQFNRKQQKQTSPEEVMQYVDFFSKMFGGKK